MKITKSENGCLSIVNNRDGISKMRQTALTTARNPDKIGKENVERGGAAMTFITGIRTADSLSLFSSEFQTMHRIII